MSKKGEAQLRKIIRDAIASPTYEPDLTLSCFGQWEEFSPQERELCVKDLNDLGNAARLISRYGKDLMFVPKSGWHAWTDKVWSRDEGDRILQLRAQKTVKKMKSEIFARAAKAYHDDTPPKEIKELFKAFCRFHLTSGNTNRLAAMCTEAKPHLTLASDRLDTHDFLFNIRNGTLNLKASDNGAESFDGIVLEKHNRKHRITKLAEVSYDPEAQAPVFNKFIHEILPDDEVRLFMQRFFGYCLTGSNEEQVLVMLWGEGSNGKSTLVDLMNRIFGSYALVTPVDSLLHTRNKGQGNEATPALARLIGARFVSAAEPDVGDRLAEGAIKNITGTEKMTARHLRQEFFEFIPQFKVCISCNNKPYVRGQDDGIWRRLLLVPFEQRFVDPALLDKNPGALPKVKNLDKNLQAEASGVLNWILDGYRMWQENGLAVPEQIRAATEEYRQESNPVREFIGGMCDRSANSSIQANRLYEAFRLWSIDNMMEVKSIQWFGRRVKELNIEKTNDGKNYYYRGFALTRAMEERLQQDEERKIHKREEDE